MDLISEYEGIIKIEGMSLKYLNNILSSATHGSQVFKFHTEDIDKDPVMYLYNTNDERKNIKCIKHYYMHQTGYNALKLEKCYDVQMNLNDTYESHMRCDRCHLNALNLAEEGKLIPLEVKQKGRKRSKIMIDTSIFE